MSTSTIELPGMQKPLSMWRNFSWIVSANVVHALSRWGMVVVLAHMGGVKVVGQVVLAIAICIPIKELANLGLRGVLATDARYEHCFSDYLSIRLISVVLAFFVTAAVALWGPYERTVVWLVLIVAFGKIFESISDIFHGLLQQHERMDRIGIALMIRGPGALVLLVGVMYLTGNLFWAMASLPLSLAITLIVYDLPNGLWVLRTGAVSKDANRFAASTLKLQWNWGNLFRLAWIALPLGIAAALISLAQNIPRYLVAHQLGDHALGIFGSIAYLASAGTLIFSAMGQSSIPRLARYHAAGNRRAFFRLIGKLEAIVLFVGVGLIGLMALAGEPILKILYGSEVAKYKDFALVLVMASAILFLCAPLGRAIQAMRQFRTQMVLRGLGVVLLIILLPPLIRSHGLMGAAFGMILSSLTLLVAFCLAIFFGSRWVSPVRDDHSTFYQTGRPRE